MRGCGRLEDGVCSCAYNEDEDDVCSCASGRLEDCLVTLDQEGLQAMDVKMGCHICTPA